MTGPYRSNKPYVEKETEEDERIYCKKCEYYSRQKNQNPAYQILQENYCTHPLVRTIVHTAVEKQVSLTKCQDANENNNCTYFLKLGLKSKSLPWWRRIFQ